MNITALSQLIAKRRTIFPSMYNQETITREEIEIILQNANWAPTHKKTEPWRWKVFTGESLNTLSEYLGNYYISDTPKDKYSDIKYKKTVNKPLKSQAVIAICMYNDPEINIPQWEELAAVSCAVQNMWLSCTALNIGSYWSSPKSAINAKEFLNLNANEKCMGWFYMGKTDVFDIQGSRTSYKDKTTWM